MSELDPQNKFLSRLPDKVIVDGFSHEATSGRKMATVDPSTEEVIVTVPRCDAADVHSACVSADAALGGPWGDLTPFERGRVLNKIADAIESELGHLSRLESLDSGKPISAARGDIQGVVDCFRYNAGATDKMEGSAIPLGDEYLDYTQPEPVGVTAHIVPWNFPLGMAARSVAPALAAGCTAVLKPAEQTPLTALALAEICLHAGLPAGVLNVVTGTGPEVGEPLTNHPLVRSVTFTGSVTTGRRVYRNAAEHIKSCVLELGGKNPMIVMADADLDRATTDALEATFANAGQVCSSASWYLLHSSIKDEFLALLEHKIQTLSIDRPENDPDIGPLVSEDHLHKVSGYIERAAAEGMKPCIRGQSVDYLKPGFFVQPMVFDDVPLDHPLAIDEVFGPIATVHTFDTDAQMTTTINRLDTGLVAGIYTRDVSRAISLSKHLDVGSVWINGWFIGGLQAPTGGEKNSGIGRERGLPGIRNYLKIKNIGVRL
ncbi:aldehyde dehydrogenase [Ruegeria sp. EL01]|jgi:acyl-CoA reductase-like NAD-dependent aldehyde dehydrogenase|uniref:aldehyde dehydrogenase family protein n=1 Tax=Ruegeria sp. EL01 TaxID=2107578 RepID=UPI000EA8343E|nr:aldehyde dehydrogenase family protein [Ruegeria sp. EL01]